MLGMKSGLGFGFLLLAVTAATGCASSSKEGAGDPMQDADLTGGKKVLADKTTSFGGSFAFEWENETVKMTYEISRVDWAAGTAVFDTKIVERGDATVYEDEALPMKIEKGSCDGCHSFFIEQDGELAVEIKFAASKLSSMSYSGVPTAGAKVSTAGEEPFVPGGGGGVPDGVGEMCGGMAGARCMSGLVCDNSLGMNTGRCVQR